jgi:dTDP-glucose 4,6-dehydratase
MNILVTGGCGFIGSNLIRLLLAETPHTVFNLDKLTYAGNLASLSDVEDNPNYRFVQGDLCDIETVRRVIDEAQPSAILHLAAESHVDRSIDGPGDFIQTNVVGTFQLLQAALSHWKTLDEQVASNFRFVHVSTDEVFGSLTSDDAAFNELTPYQPHSPYSASKASSDHLVRAWHDTYGLPIIITNCSNNYGPFQFPEKLVPVVILKCLRNEAIPVYGKGENIRDWLYVEDHCRAITQSMHAGIPGETYCIGGDNEIKNIDLVKLICNLMDERRPRTDCKSYANQIEFVTDRPGHDLRYAIDATKIKSELNWKAQEDPASGFSKTVDWYLANETWWSSILDGSYQMDRIGIGN